GRGVDERAQVVAEGQLGGGVGGGVGTVVGRRRPGGRHCLILDLAVPAPGGGMLQRVSERTPTLPADPPALAAALEATGYLPDEGLATAAYLALAMHRPLFLEGEAGVGKTAL